MRHLPRVVIALCLSVFPSALLAQTWSLDPDFKPALVNDASFLLNASFVPAPGGQLLAYGDFTHVNGTPAPGLARLGADGKLDPSFVSDLAADERVLGVAPLPDGRVVALIGSATPVTIAPIPAAVSLSVPVVAVSTTSVVFESKPTLIAKLIRLRVDGRKDLTYPALSILSYGGYLGGSGVANLTELSDGRVLVWGNFSTIGSQGYDSLAQLKTDGTLDTGVAPSLRTLPAPPPLPLPGAPSMPTMIVTFVSPLNVTAVATAVDGALLLSATDYSVREYFFVRLLANGSIDTRFAPGTVGTTYNLLAVQPDGSVLAGNGNLTRYTPSGAIAPTYAPKIPGLKTISSIAPLPDGRLAVEATVGAASAIGAPAVFTLGVNGQLERDFRKVSGAREGQRLLATLADGRVLVAQGTLVLSTSYYPVPVDIAVPTTTSAIMPVFLGPILADPVLALSSIDGSALTPLPTTIAYRYTGSVSRLETDSTGRVLAAGAFTQIDGQPRAGLARFLANGTLDPGYAPASGEVLFALPDGRVIVRRTTVGPLGDDGFHRYETQIVRLQLDGSVDASFAFPSTFDPAKTNWLAAAPDGRLLISAFDPDANLEQNLKLIWLGSDGRRLSTLSATFTGFTRSIVMPMYASGVAVPVDQVPIIYPIGTGLPNVLDAAQLLSGNQLLVAGAFSRVNGAARPGVVRLLGDGSLDASYVPDFDAQTYSYSRLPLPDGRVLVFGGSYVGIDTGIAGTAFSQWRSYVLRLRTDGSIDPTFAPPTDTIPAGACRLADGSFFANGRRFFADGWPDLNFAPQFRSGTGTGSPSYATLTADGRLWLGGSFDQVNGQSRSSLARFVPAEVVGISVPPQSQTIVAGRTVFFQVVLGTSRPATYQWLFNGAPLAGAQGPTLTLTNVRPTQAGSYQVRVTIDGQTFTSAVATLTVTPSTARLTSFSARSRVASGEPQIAGMVTSTATPRPVLLRAVGRGLQPFYLGAPLLAEPVLGLYAQNQLLAENRGGILAPAIKTLAQRSGAFPINPSPLVPGQNYGSALASTLGGGVFTAQTASGDGDAGISLFEFYDTDNPATEPFVRSISVRGRTGAGADVLIAGFVIAGNGPLKLLLRGVGPTLAQFGVSDAVADPSFAVYRAGSSSPFASNDDWGGAADVADAALRTGAFSLPAGSKDAALILTLEPGVYTMQVSAAGAAGGEALAELYIVDP